MALSQDIQGSLAGDVGLFRGKYSIFLRKIQGSFAGDIGLFRGKYRGLSPHLATFDDNRTGGRALCVCVRVRVRARGGVVEACWLRADVCLLVCAHVYLFWQRADTANINAW